MVLSGRQGLDKFVGTGKTVKFGLICLPDTKYKSKIRFSQITYSGHMIGFDEKVFVQGGAKKSGLQYAMVELWMSGRHRDEKVSSFAILGFFLVKIYKMCKKVDDPPGLQSREYFF